MASTLPSRVLATPKARPDNAARAASMASSESDLPCPGPLLAVGPVDFDDDETHSMQVTGEAGPVGARAFHPDQADLPKGAHPGTELLVAGEVGGKGLHAEQAALGVDHRRHMDICVRIDAARQGALEYLP